MITQGCSLRMPPFQQNVTMQNHDELCTQSYLMWKAEMKERMGRRGKLYPELLVLVILGRGMVYKVTSHFVTRSIRHSLKFCDEMTARESAS